MPVDATAPARKRAVKKTATTKKVAVKKTATKTAKTKAVTADIDPVTTDAPAAKKRATRKTVEAAETNSNAAPAANPAPPAPQAPFEENRKIGRVPGGGRVTARQSSDQPEQAAPAPQAPHEQRPHHERQAPHAGDDGQQRDSRSKRRRDKRKRRGAPFQKGDAPRGDAPCGEHHEARHGEFEERRPIALSGPKIAVDGMLELAPKGFGFLRVPHKNFEQARDDVFVSPESIRKHNLRLGQWIHGNYQEGPRGPQLVEITAVNGTPPEEAAKFPHFDELKAVNPNKRISFETTPERFTTRVVDIMAPVGRGQRGLIVSPPRSGKTTLLLHMAEAVREKYDESIHLMVLLVDERPEEVTEFRRTLPGAEIYASSNDEQPRNHCRIAELAIERAKRLVEAGKDVFLLMDSITRLARAYNNTMNNRGRGTGSGGITIGALEVPRRLFAAARNTRGGGSLTILATALIQTNSRADEAIFMEFKGTGNMELVLDRKIAENYIYPAVDIFKSGTRREELLIPEHMLHKIHLIRRGLSGHRPVEAMERLLFFLKKFPNNPQMLLEIKG
ncbi:MAG: transcription termination factor Rho [Akkermansiaceae bacterium]|nr:transcription termination factor Rho [Akkermansiaceae bacterium]